MIQKLLILCLMFVTVKSFAIPLGRNFRGPVRVPHGFTQNYNFDGIVALDDCSGAVVRFSSSLPTDHAMVLTNGHCFEGGMPKPNTFVYHKASNREFMLLGPNAKDLGLINATQVLYSTMTNTDITLYQVQQTYQEIFDKWAVHPLLLSAAHPSVNEPMQVISGYWRRGYSCSIAKFVYELREANWTSHDSIRFTEPGCETIPGTSGAPIIDAQTRQIIGINNTGNDDGGKCTEDNPCEVDQSGNVTYEKGADYGQQTYWIYSCINANRDFDLSVPGCALFH